MLVDKENIQKLIPQRPPFVMIDNLISADESGFSSNFELRDEVLLRQDQLVSESTITEHVAQTCAAGFGYLGQKEQAGEPKIGYIGAVTKLKVHQLPKLGDVLETKVAILQNFENIHLVQGNVFVNETEIFTCQMKIVLA